MTARACFSRSWMLLQKSQVTPSQKAQLPAQPAILCRTAGPPGCVWLQWPCHPWGLSVCHHGRQHQRKPPAVNQMPRPRPPAASTPRWPLTGAQDPGDTGPRAHREHSSLSEPAGHTYGCALRPPATALLGTGFQMRSAGPIGSWDQ